jgi:hypothetical protein
MNIAKEALRIQKMAEEISTLGYFTLEAKAKEKDF